MRSRSRTIVLLLFTVSILQAAEAISPADFRVGMPLTTAIQKLQKYGVETVFSSQVVRPEMKVRRAISSQQPREILTQLLVPHRLDVREGPNGVLIIVRGRLQQDETRAAPVSPMLAEEIVVQPSRISLLIEEPVGSMGLTREEIQTVPHFGDDVFRALTLLPGTTSNDLSSQFNLRGGRSDELLILLDGQELYDPYHLKDFDNALSIIGASALARVHLISAAFPVSYGDRMSGVLNMVTVTPAAERRFQIGVSVFGAQVEASDSYQDVSWIASLRSGSTDLLGQVFELDEARYWDFFGKLDYVVSPRQTFRIHALTSEDHLDTSGESDETVAAEEQKLLNTQYRSSYLWLTHRGIVNERLFVDTSASVTDVRRNRFGSEDDDDRSFEVNDERQLNVAGFLQSWSFAASPRHFVNAGTDYQKFSAVYDYASQSDFTTPLVTIGSPPHGGAFSFADRFGSERLGLYASDRMRLLDALTVEFGIRYDRQNSVDDNVVSPRLNAAWAISPNGVMRLGWGHFSQSHRPYEMMVEDGDATLYPAERSQHWVLGYEHLFGTASRVPLSSLRVESYRRHVTNPRPRYESLFQPFDPFPEGEFDRVRIEAESATAQGLELLLWGRPMRRIDWWLNYSLASTEDRINGRDVLRGIDQTHALNLDVNYRLSRDWNVNMAWVYRTGHPVTPIAFDDSGHPILGDMNSERLDPYHRLDLRVGRDWKIREGTLSLFVDAHNLYNQQNISGLDLGVDDDTGDLVAGREHWPGLFISAGITWTFQ
jgi:outer membrane receptor for ferrienterochelin and colicin